MDDMGVTECDNRHVAECDDIGSVRHFRKLRQKTNLKDVRKYVPLISLFLGVCDKAWLMRNVFLNVTSLTDFHNVKSCWKASNRLAPKCS